VVRDLRRYARQTKIRLFVGFLLILLLIGDGLIWILYGREAAFWGLTCVLMGFAPLLLIGLALWLMDWIIHRVNRD
jgi:hypothetical protein